MLALLLSALAAAQPHHANPDDPRHHFDTRCPPGVTMDPAGRQRDPASSSSYLWTPLPKAATVTDCVALCCHDWSCEAFAFVEPRKEPAPAPGPGAATLTGDWVNHDSLRGESHITMTQSAGGRLSAKSLDVQRSAWSVAVGAVATGGTSGYLFFGSPTNNRTFTVSADKNELFLDRLSFDPPGFTQNFTRARAGGWGPGGNCTSDAPCCIFKDDLDAIVANPAGSGVSTGRRAKLPARPPPYPNSTAVKSAVLHPKMEVGTCRCCLLCIYMPALDRSLSDCRYQRR